MSKEYVGKLATTEVVPEISVLETSESHEQQNIVLNSIRKRSCLFAKISSNGYNFQALIDSGSVVSILSVTVATKLGINLDMLKRVNHTLTAENGR